MPAHRILHAAVLSFGFQPSHHPYLALRGRPAEYNERRISPISNYLQLVKNSSALLECVLRG
jgi:hypothetical protein